MPKLSKETQEKRFYEIWESWPAEDRKAAIKVLQRLQELSERKPAEPKPGTGRVGPETGRLPL